MRPSIFWKLEASAAGQFIRQVFPVYYLAIGVTSAIAAAALALGSTHTRADATALELVYVGFWVVRQSLMPIINRTRDANLTGDARAGRQLKRLHGVSVLTNAIQVVIVLLRFVWQ